MKLIRKPNQLQRFLLWYAKPFGAGVILAEWLTDEELDRTLHVGNNGSYVDTAYNLAFGRQSIARIVRVVMVVVPVIVVAMFSVLAAVVLSVACVVMGVGFWRYGRLGD